MRLGLDGPGSSLHLIPVRFRVTTALAAVAVAATSIAIASGGHSSRPAPAGGGVTAGLQITAGPWAPEYSQLAKQLQALHLPSQSDINYHVHAGLRIYVHGRQMPVPRRLGSTLRAWRRCIPTTPVESSTSRRSSPSRFRSGRYSRSGA